MVMMLFDDTRASCCGNQAWHELMGRISWGCGDALWGDLYGNHPSTVASWLVGALIGMIACIQIRAHHRISKAIIRLFQGYCNAQCLVFWSLVIMSGPCDFSGVGILRAYGKGVFWTSISSLSGESATRCCWPEVGRRRCWPRRGSRRCCEAFGAS